VPGILVFSGYLAALLIIPSILVQLVGELLRINPLAASYFPYFLAFAVGIAIIDLTALLVRRKATPMSIAYFLILLIPLLIILFLKTVSSEVPNELRKLMGEMLSPLPFR